MKIAEATIKTKWDLDPAHSEIAFKVKHLMITNIKGVFKKFGANIQTTDENFKAGEIELWIDPASIDTGDAKRDAHLKGPEFFDTENHEKILFKASHFENLGKNGKGTLSGSLTIKGIKKEVTLDTEYSGTAIDPWGNKKAGFIVTGKINRKDWGLDWNQELLAGGVLVSEQVTINCEVELVKKGDS